MNGSRRRSRKRRLPLLTMLLLACGFAAGLLLPGTAAAAAAAARAATWKDWWLPDDYSAHGPDIDWLFTVIFWITMVVFVGVELLLVYFAVKYRFRPGRKKGIFSHGNTKLEMAWTLLPAVILLWISLASKRVWDEYRYGNANDRDRAQLMVIGQQFKWNVVYPGPDGKLGRYLSYPKPSDPQFAHKPADQAARDVGAALQENPLGQRINPNDPTDPGLDDDTTPQPGRPLIVPVDKPLEIALGSRDVLHSFFLPNFRVKLDAVPGMRGTIFFTAKKQSTRSAPVELVPEDKVIWLDSSTPKAFVFSNPPSYHVFDPKVIAPSAPDPYAVDPNTLDVPTLNKLIAVRSQRNRKFPWLQSLQSTLRSGALQRLRDRAAATEGGPAFDPATAPPELIAGEVMALRQDLKRMGINQLSYVEQTFEIVCEELCGGGHPQMTGQMIVVSQDQYRRFLNKQPPGVAPVAPPAPAPAEQQSQPAPAPTTAPASDAAAAATTTPATAPATQETAPATGPTTATTTAPATAPAPAAAPAAPTPDAAPAPPPNTEPPPGPSSQPPPATTTEPPPTPAPAPAPAAPNP